MDKQHEIAAVTDDLGSEVANMLLGVNLDTAGKKPTLRNRIWALLTGIED